MRMRTRRSKIRFFLLGSCCALLDPHFLIGTLDFPACLQTSRPGVRPWVDAGSSNGMERHPTCHFVQVIIGHGTAKAGAQGASAPCVFLCRRNSLRGFRRRDCSLLHALRTLRRLRSIFRQAHVLAENVLILFAASAANSARLLCLYAMSSIKW